MHKFLGLTRRIIGNWVDTQKVTRYIERLYCIPTFILVVTQSRYSGEMTVKNDDQGRYNVNNVLKLRASASHHQARIEIFTPKFCWNLFDKRLIRSNFAALSSIVLWAAGQVLRHIKELLVKRFSLSWPDHFRAFFSVINDEKRKLSRCQMEAKKCYNNDTEEYPRKRFQFSWLRKVQQKFRPYSKT